MPHSELPGHSHPIFEVAKVSWMLIESLLLMFEGDFAVIEDCNRCVKWIIRSLNSYTAPMFESISIRTAEQYLKFQYPSCLYISSILVDVFAPNPAHAEHLLQLFNTMVKATLSRLGPMDEISSKPELIEDFFRLATMMMVKLPALLLKDGAIALAIFQFASAAVLVPNRDTNLVVVEFLLEFVGSYQKYGTNVVIQSALLQILQSCGVALVHNLLSAVAGSVPSFMIPDVSEVMWELLYVAREHFVACAPSAPGLQPPLDSRVSSSDVERLIRAMAT